MVRRFDLKTELILATLPTAIIVAVLLLLKAFSKQELLFASLASSAFLIYLDPKNPANSIRTLLIAQTAAAIVGYVVYIFAGPGYLSAALSMVVIVLLMIFTKAMHPPAVASALNFAFQHTKPDTLALFLFALLLLVLLIIIQRISLWLVRRKEKINHRNNGKLARVYNQTS